MRIWLIILFCLTAIAYTEGYTLVTAQKLYKEKKYAEACTVYAYIGMNREAIRPYMQYAVADCLLHQGKFQEALEVLVQIKTVGRKTLQDEVQDLTYACYYGLARRSEITDRENAWYGEYLFSKNRFAESLACLQAISPEARTTRNIFIQGRDYLSIGEFVSANRVLRTLDSPEALYYRANACVQIGRRDIARQLYTTVAIGQSDFAPNALHQLARLALGQGNMVASNAYYRQIIHRFPKSNLADDAAWTLGWRLYRAGQYALAESVFSHGYRQHSTGDYSDALLFWAGKCAWRKNNKESAKVIWQKVATQFPGRYYGLRAAELVSVNIITTGLLPAPTGKVPESIRQFIIEQAYREALADLEQISANMSEQDIMATQRAIAMAATDTDDYSRAVRAMYPVFQRAELNGYMLLTQQDWELYFPLAFGGTVRTMQKKHTRVPEALVYAVMREESLFDPDIVSAAGASGLMQLMPGTAKLLALRYNTLWEEERLTYPETNIGYGVLYLNNLLIRYKDSLPVSLAGYNAGPVATDRWYKLFTEDMDEWIENLTYRETRGYVKKVLRSFYWYNKLYFSAK